MTLWLLIPLLILAYSAFVLLIGKCLKFTSIAPVAADGHPHYQQDDPTGAGAPTAFVRRPRQSTIATPESIRECLDTAFVGNAG